MNDNSALDLEYSKIVTDNPNKKFILYLRSHPEDEMEKSLLRKLVASYGQCKELTEERLAIFIVKGNEVQDFIQKLNSSKTSLYLSYIQSEDELKK